MIWSGSNSSPCSNLTGSQFRNRFFYCYSLLNAAPCKVIYRCSYLTSSNFCWLFSVVNMEFLSEGAYGELFREYF